MHLLYEGQSLIDGSPIVALLTGIDNPSTNAKTGPMLQTWILRQDIKPSEAVKSKQDESICGSCPNRGGVCYVLPFQGPNSIWDAYSKSNYKQENLKKLGRNRTIRLGSYGNPSAVPHTVWRDLIQYSDGYSGYEHEPFVQPEIMDFCQASADNIEDAELYQSMGWKTFRIKGENDPLLPGEILCPYEKTGVQCIQCRLCDGKSKNIAVNVHGAAHKKKAFYARESNVVYGQ